jgi:peroxiredoxin
VLVLLLSACDSSANHESTSTPTQTATPAPLTAPDFTLQILDGGSFSLSEQLGRWVVLNFWATWCEPCKLEMPDLQRIIHSYGDQVVLVGINLRETPTLVRAFAEAHGVQFPLLLNPDDKLLSDYLVMGLPLTVVVDPSGYVALRQFGPVDPDFQGMLAALVSQ